MPILSNIKLIKIDSDSKEIIKSDFVFGLYADKECTKLIQEVKSDKETGTILFEGVRYGKGFIKEISQPKGYELSNDVIEVEINNKGVFINGMETKENEGVYSFEFANKKLQKVQTGNETNYILLVFIIVISIIAITRAAIVLRKNKKENN